MSRQPVLYFSDILCVWAYVGQIRIDRLLEQEADRIDLEPRFCPIFGDSHGGLARRWGDRGGMPAYAAHVRSVCARFDHVTVHPAVWTEVAPASSLAAHVFLAAIRALEGAGEVATGSFQQACWAFRTAFFQRGCDIAARGVHYQIAEEMGLDVGAIERCLERGEAQAGLSGDYERARDLDIRTSPTLILNHGRQRLTGNVGFRIIAANVRELLRDPGLDDASWC